MVRFHRPRKSDTGRLPLSSKIKALVFAIAAFTLIYLVIDDDDGNNAAVETQVRDLNSANNAILRGGGVADSPHSAATQNENNSLLDTYSESNLPLCSAMRISLSGSTEFDENKPTIFTDWSPDAINKWKDRNSFKTNYGKYPQYVKGGDVQPLKNSQGEKCTARTSTLINVLEERFNSEPISQHSAFDDSGSADKGFTVFSAMEQGSSHPFHFHDAAWLGQISGARLWYLLPPGTSKTTVGAKVNGCDYLTGAAPIPNGANACIQRSGEVFYLPPNWLHASCALEQWTVGVGGQGGSPKGYEQDFPVPTVNEKWTEDKERTELAKCSASGHQFVKDGSTTNEADAKDGITAPVEKSVEQKDKKAAAVKNNDDEQEWKWFDGNLGEYYDKLERDEHAKRKPDVITSYAVHRWMGPERKTLEHYVLIRKAIYEAVLGKLPPPGEEVSQSSSPLRVFDGGCGLGAGLMWFEKHEPNWTMIGHTISEEQYKWITTDLPKHKFTARLLTYDKPLGEDKDDARRDEKYHAIYSIEAAIHSPKLASTIKAWSDALEPGGIIVIIDDFLSVGVSKDDPDVDLFARSWIANSVHSTTEVAVMAQQSDMTLIEDRDLGSQYQIAKLNYRNTVPKLRDENNRVHQGWLGSKARQRLFLEGKITYRMIVLQKKGGSTIGESKQPKCTSIATAGKGEEKLAITINPTLMTGTGKEGGKQQECLSGWYCCGKGQEYWDDLAATRTVSTGYLKLPRELFGDYLQSFAAHLTDFYSSYPLNYPGNEKKGVFLDIGGTGSVASGMTQVTSKFEHFSGPLDYWVLDSDPSAKRLSNAIVCDIDDCSAALDCEYDVTFSFTVLEHAARPWKSFDTIARITKKGGLTLHLVPWSYQWHATPQDNYRFSHTALETLLQDRGFEVLEVGYDICNQPELVRKKKKDEHFEVIWLTYVVGRKL